MVGDNSWAQRNPNPLFVNQTPTSSLHEQTPTLLSSASQPQLLTMQTNNPTPDLPFSLKPVSKKQHASKDSAMSEGSFNHQCLGPQEDLQNHPRNDSNGKERVGSLCMVMHNHGGVAHSLMVVFRFHLPLSSNTQEPDYLWPYIVIENFVECWFWLLTSHTIGYVGDARQWMEAKLQCKNCAYGQLNLLLTCKLLHLGIPHYKHVGKIGATQSWKQ